MPFRLHDRTMYCALARRRLGCREAVSLAVAIPAAQAETAALLRALAGAAPVETHISAVFLGADTVWKLRKAVRLPFVDFSRSPSAGARRCARWS